MVCRVEVQEGSLVITLTEVCRGLSDLQITATDAEGAEIQCGSVGSKDCDKVITVSIPDTKVCAVEIKQAKAVTEFSSLVGVRLFRDCVLDVDFEAKTAKGQKKDDTDVLKAIFEGEIANLIDLLAIEPDLHLATHRLLDLKMLLHLLLANPHYGQEP